jgi:hypothetical protein
MIHGHARCVCLLWLALITAAYVELTLSPAGADANPLTVEHLASPPTPSATFRIRAVDSVTRVGIIGLPVEMVVVVDANAPGDVAGFRASTEELVGYSGRTDSYGFLNLTSLAFLSCGLHRLAGRMTETRNVTTIAGPATYAYAVRKANSCGGQVFLAEPTPIGGTSALHYVVPNDVRSDVASAFCKAA